jgi:ATP-dependent helicase HrpB
MHPTITGLAALPILPISEVLPQLKQSLAHHHELVLEAPPGAGKTTLVPLTLLSESWLADQRIIMLEPRRMAARAAAQRMASLLNEETGQTVGYRIRQESRISSHTRIEVITEGILTRMLVDDPSLEGVALLIFDEFHERSMDADLGLALALQSRELFRDASKPLRLMAMSATLDGDALASLLGNAPLIRSAGKMFPVTMHYGPAKRPDDNIVECVLNALPGIIRKHSGSLLVFLPGQGEINKVIQSLAGRLSPEELQELDILPLYGALPLREQQRAIESLTAKRKVVLSTDIAETSLTIEGINVVVDAGFCRVPRFDPATGMTRLQTRRISKDSSVQRMGRAGRLTAGHCYRLWSEQQQEQLAQQSMPQILQADLAPLVMHLIAWGIDDINQLRWLDPPPSGTMSQALDLLLRLGAIKGESTGLSSLTLGNCSLSLHGELMSRMPTHPRLAHMLITGAARQQIKYAAALAALLADRSPLARDHGADLSGQLAVLLGQQACHSQYKGWLKRTQQQAKTFERLVQTRQTDQGATDNLLNPGNVIGFLLACAYPDRIAHRKPGRQNHYLLSNGRTATLDQGDTLSSSEWLAVAELGGTMNRDGMGSNDRIFSACALDPALFDNQLSELIHEKDILHWDDQTDRFSAEHVRTIGKLVIHRQRIEKIPVDARRDALIELLKKRGLNILPWTHAIRQWQSRVMLLNRLGLGLWPDVSDQYLLMTIETWLAPFLDPISKLSDFQQLDLQSILSGLLPWPLPKQLEELAPKTMTVPSGSNIKIDYTQSPPVLSVKLQEMFGCVNTPTIANGKIKLMLHLLSPAQRPLQVTQDLAGFWKSSYSEVKKEMKGRYPRHPWPDSPEQALPTKYTKRRS